MTLAFEKLEQVAGIANLSSSSLYRTPPIGPKQPDYLNGVFQLTCSLDPFELLEVLHAIEKEAGRDREHEIRWGPRPLDLDILLFGAQAIATQRLTIPHKELHKRAFVLIPLAELQPNLRIGGKSAQELALELYDPSICKTHTPIGES